MTRREMVLPAFGGFPMQHTTWLACDHLMMLEVRKSKRLDVKSVSRAFCRYGTKEFF
jgi:hypothetical protein